MKLQELVRTENDEEVHLNTRNYWHLIISNNIMALENTVIQDKLTAAFGEMCFTSRKDIFSFEIPAEITAIVLFLK
jgi:hypothetical protein